MPVKGNKDGNRMEIGKIIEFREQRKFLIQNLNLRHAKSVAVTSHCVILIEASTTASTLNSRIYNLFPVVKCKHYYVINYVVPI